MKESRGKPAKPSAIPPVRVEPSLKAALEAIARQEGRSLSYTIRGLLRVAVKENAR